MPAGIDRSAQDLQRMRQRLIGWYKSHHRRLPWRETSDPYAIWVSEIMLQQTQVATVIDYYHRFLIHFPDVHALANADEQQVLGLWSGLGYYRRARQMHAAARVLVDEHRGVFPRQLDQLQALPGVGRYTAGAIASFAFDLRAPILEANTVRLFSRLIALRESPQSGAGQRQLWAFAEDLLPVASLSEKTPAGNRGRPGAGLTNQAAMELGSLVCSPVPTCESCPLKSDCRAYAAGAQAEIPLVHKKPPPTPLLHVALLVRDGDSVLMRQNGDGEWWVGLWDLPKVDLSDCGGLQRLGPAQTLADSEAELIAARFQQRFGVEIQPTCYAMKLQHAVTRYRITVHCLESLLARGKDRLPEGWRFVQSPQWPPLTSPAKRIVHKLCPY